MEQLESPALCFLHVEQEVQHVSVFDDILLALGAEQAFFLCCTETAAAFDQLVIGDGLCPDKASLKIGVDAACCLRRLCSSFDGPGAAFVFTGCEEGDQIQQVVRSFDQLVEARFADAQLFQEHSFFLRPPVQRFPARFPHR